MPWWSIFLPGRMLTTAVPITSCGVRGVGSLYGLKLHTYIYIYIRIGIFVYVYVQYMYTLILTVLKKGLLRTGGTSQASEGWGGREGWGGQKWVFQRLLRFRVQAFGFRV